MYLIDTHTHVDFYDNPKDIVAFYNKYSILTIFMTFLPEIFDKHVNEMINTKYIRLALGYHPSMILNYEFKKELFNKSIPKTNYIGEIGLDFTVTKDSKMIDKQIEIFNYITKVTNQTKILSVHSKKSEVETFKILKKNEVKHAIFHWYSGPLSLINDIANYGYFFSVNLKMLETTRGKKIIKKIPIEKLLFETDGPFIKYGNKPINPCKIKKIYKYLSEFLNCKNIEDVIFNNFVKLLNQRKKSENRGKFR